MTETIPFAIPSRFRLRWLAVMFAVWLCQSGVCQAADRYAVSGDGQEVTDLRTGLIWRRCSEGQNWNGADCIGNVARFTWEEALQRAALQAGSTGVAWRLPNIKELSSLADRKRSQPAIDPVAFPSASSDWFWSSSPYAWYSGDAWVVNFDYSSVSRNYRWWQGAVRLVRAGQ